MLFGLLNLSVWGYFIALMILTQITILSVTIFLHRHQAHRALELHPSVSHFFRFWLWMTTGMKTNEWVAVHRKHHAYTERDGDPHSPQLFGIKQIVFNGTELYRKAANDPAMVEKYSRGTPNDWMEKRVYGAHARLGISMMLILDLVLFGLPGLAFWALQMMWIPFFAAGVVNGIGHYWGYRNYECHDAARNIIPLGIFIGGEELHNNHHTFASSAKLSSKWWEFDSGWLVIKTLSFFKLAKIKKLPPKLLRSPSKSTIDYETVSALFLNRFQVLARYTREVITPVLKEGNQKSTNPRIALSRHWARLISRDKNLLSVGARARLAKLLQKRRQLRTVCIYHKNLQAIWKQSAHTQRELVEALQAWCARAEASGNAYLEQFSQYIRGLTLNPVRV